MPQSNAPTTLTDSQFAALEKREAHRELGNVIIGGVLVAVVVFALSIAFRAQLAALWATRKKVLLKWFLGLVSSIGILMCLQAPASYFGATVWALLGSVSFFSGLRWLWRTLL